jgi:hypothetical protein
MLDQKVEQWIRDFEAKFYDIDDVNKKSHIPIDLIYDLRHNSTVIRIDSLKTESGTEEIIYCYIPSSKPGLIHGYVLGREDGKIGSMVSHGYLSLEDFITNHIPSRPKKESKIKKYALPAFIGTIIPVTYIGLRKWLGHQKEKG